MRITNNMTSYGFLRSLNNSQQQQYKLQEQLADGKAIHHPSDDPVKTVRSLQYNTSLGINTQYTQNLQDAQMWMQTTDGAMSDLSSIMINIKEKVVQASNGSNPQTAVQAIGTEVDALINHMVDIGNTKIGDRYVFSGQNDQTQPFTRIGDVVTYSGDNNKISMPIQPGIANPSQDSVNLTGQDVFGVNLQTINDLIAIKQHLQSGTSADQDWLGGRVPDPLNPGQNLVTGLATLDADHTQMLRAQTGLGARMAMYDMAQTMMENSATAITQDLSSNDDVDVAKATMEFKNSQNVYQAALSVGAKTMPTSLVDFLK